MKIGRALDNLETGYFFACSQNKFVDEAMKSTRQSLNRIFLYMLTKLICRWRYEEH